jgi:acetyl/propionyl-CoA carboxylase alpha subunit
MLAKLAVWAGTRSHAIARMRRALGEYHISGVRTNLSLFAELLTDEAFARGELSTGFLDEFFRRRVVTGPDADIEAVAALAAHAAHSLARPGDGPRAAPASRWQTAGRDGLLR